MRRIRGVVVVVVVMMVVVVIECRERRDDG